MFYLRNDHTDSCYCRNWKVTPDPGPVSHKFLPPGSDPGPNEKHRNLLESTPTIRIHGHLWCELIKPHACACYICIISSFVINWQFRRIHGRPQGGKTGISPLEIGTKDQNFLETMKVAVQSRLIDLVLAMTVYLPVCHSRRTRARFTVLVSQWACSSLMSTPLRGQTWERFFCCWFLLCNSNISANLPSVISKLNYR